jgi:hypothetical protein
MTLGSVLDTKQASAWQFSITSEPYHPSSTSPITPSQVTLARAFRRAVRRGVLGWRNRGMRGATARAMTPAVVR